MVLLAPLSSPAVGMVPCRFLKSEVGLVVSALGCVDLFLCLCVRGGKGCDALSGNLAKLVRLGFFALLSDS